MIIFVVLVYIEYSIPLNDILERKHPASLVTVQDAPLWVYKHNKTFFLIRFPSCQITLPSPSLHILQLPSRDYLNPGNAFPNALRQPELLL